MLVTTEFFIFFRDLVCFTTCFVQLGQLQVIQLCRTVYRICGRKILT